MNHQQSPPMSSVAGAAPSLGTGTASVTHRPLGLQTFTVMVPLEADFEGTLKAIADLGYREVETMGAFGRDPQYVRSTLDKYGLVSPSQHLLPGDLYGVMLRYTRKELSLEETHTLWTRQMSVDKVAGIIEEGIARARVLGQQFLVWQMLWPEEMSTRSAIDAVSRALNTAGALCAKAGLQFNFHNHADEFKRYSDYVPYQVLLDSTDPATVQFELDVHWTTRAGGDPIDYLARYPGRYTQLHLKDSTVDGDFATVGRGIIDFPAILRAAHAAGIQHYYVEYDRSDDAMTVTRDAIEYLQPLMR